jgi:hypothetical protein
VLQAAFTALAEEGLLSLLATPVGLKIAVVDDQRAAVEGLVKGQRSSAALEALLQA